MKHSSEGKTLLGQRLGGTFFLFSFCLAKSSRCHLFFPFPMCHLSPLAVGRHVACSSSALLKGTGHHGFFLCIFVFFFSFSFLIFLSLSFFFPFFPAEPICTLHLRHPRVLVSSKGKLLHTSKTQFLHLVLWFFSAAMQGTSPNSLVLEASGGFRSWTPGGRNN